MDYRTNLTAQWYNATQNAESDAFGPTARVLGNTEQYVGNSLHTQHQTSPKGSLPVQRGRRESKKGQTPAVRKFRCTFCCDSFKDKYTWSRHELTLHLNLDRWKCTPFGLLTVSPLDGTPVCSYCGFDNPTEAHFKEHEGLECDKEKVFARKDNLVHHLKSAHKVKAVPPWAKTWSLEPPNVTSRCGFCDERFASWDERKEHLTEHFHQGKTMWDWEGEHDFAPEIAAQVRKAIPPYMIAAKSAERENSMARYRSLLKSAKPYPHI
jgi:hypothetical protein